MIYQQCNAGLFLSQSWPSFKGFLPFLFSYLAGGPSHLNGLFGGDGSIIGLISHISSRNGGELLMNLITRYKTVRKSYLDKTNHVTQPAGHAGAVKKNLILSHQKNPVNFQLPRSYHKMQERGFRVTLLW